MFKLFNSLTSKTEVLEKNKVINIYCCGPTVYSYIHIGNARPILLTDTVIRFLSLQNIDVNFLTNITDIDDKIINKANSENKTEKDLSEFYSIKFIEDLKKMNIIMPKKILKVTENIEEIVKFIEALEVEGSAYNVNGNVFFSIDKNIDKYGNLSKQNIQMLENSEKNENLNDKKNPLDFALWKKTKTGVTFDSKWGKGRPGWHTECSVFNDMYFKDTIDLHIGGIDLKFPHHENERIQFVAKNKKELSKFWIYNGHLSIDSQKMSKSLNNTILVRDFIKDYGPNILRYLFLNTNYKNPINITDKLIDESIKWNMKNVNLFKTINWKVALGEVEFTDETFNEKQYLTRILIYFNNDINTPMVITELDAINKQINQQLRERKISKKLYDFYFEFMKKIGFCYIIKVLEDNDLKKLKQWTQAIISKDFDKSDKLRNELLSEGIL